MDHYKGFYFRGLSSSLLAHAHINMQLYLHTVSPPLIVDRIGVVNNTEHAYYSIKIYIFVGINFCGRGSIRENRKHLNPQNIQIYPVITLNERKLVILIFLFLGKSVLGVLDRYNRPRL